MLALAFRHLLSRPRQTVLTVLGIFFGAAAFIVISGLFLGFRYFMVDQLVNNDAHVRISAREDYVEEHSLDRDFFGPKLAHVFWRSPPSGRKGNPTLTSPRNWYRRLAGDPRVAAFSPQLNAHVIYTFARTSLSGTLIGCDARAQEKVTNIRESMDEGKFLAIEAPGNQIIVGDGLLRKLGARVSQTLLIAVGENPPVPFKVAGVFHTGIQSLDDQNAYANLSDVQKVNHTPSQINEIAVRMVDFSRSSDVAAAWASTSQEKITSWDTSSQNFRAIFRMQDAMRFMMIAVVLIVAGFGIYNTLSMAVNQKKKEIAILRSMGFEAKDVILLFLSQGIFLGLLGGILGIAAGYGLCRFLSTIRFSDGPHPTYLHISFSPDIYFKALLFAGVVAGLASLLPARAASQLTPIQIIREGAE